MKPSFGRTQPQPLHHSRTLRGRLSALVSTLVLVPALAAHAQTPADTSSAALQSAFRKYAAADSVVGASLLVVRNGATVLHDNVGLGDRALMEPITNADGTWSYGTASRGNHSSRRSGSNSLR